MIGSLYQTIAAVVTAGLLVITIEVVNGHLRPESRRGTISMAIGIGLLAIAVFFSTTGPRNPLLSVAPLDDFATRMILQNIVGYLGGLVFLTGGIIWRIAGAADHLQIVRAADDLREKTRQFNSAQEVINGIVRSSVSGVMILNAIRNRADIVTDFECVFMNEEAEQVLGHRAADLRDQPILQHVPSLKKKGLFDEAINVLNTRSPFRDERSCTRDGTEMWYQIAIVKHGDGIIATFTDVSARMHTEKKLAHAAKHDALTDLPSRSQIVDRITEALTRGKRFPDYHFAVLLLDIDRFQIINDSLGHELGNRLLISISKRLQENVRDLDTSTHIGAEHVPARLGGDEFVVLLDGIPDARAAMVVAERLQDALSQPHHIDGHEVIATASIGIVTSDGNYEHPDHILRDADTAMFQAKNTGKARAVIFDEKMHQKVLARLTLEKELRVAASELKDFRLNYQPIISLDTLALKGFEALIRWHHPERGIVSPFHFIDLAEELGLIVPIGAWVTREAVTQLKRWQESRTNGPPLTMTINLAKTQLAHPDLVSSVADVIKTLDIDPHSIVMEITESTVMDNFEGMLTVLDGLHDIGVRLAIDDFGTGHSSLSFLHKVPMDILKIDRSFIMKTGEAGRHDAIVRTIVRLAHDLDAEVVAEGIETPEQMALLTALKCNYGQGYLFAKPLEAADAAAFLADDYRFSAAA